MAAASSSASSTERGSAGCKRERRRAWTRAEEEMPDDEEQAVAGAPCGACRTLRRMCVPGCVFVPYFTADDFAAVHGVFGASNVSKMLERIELPEQRRVAAATLVEEAKARQRDPTFGHVSYIRVLQEVNDKAREQVDARAGGDR
ncbi:LOB domain-containing protein 17-like [Miscanthus floridulus]|uniref:LOB domain-containing protein 17-like n=1 Tax=Miscanthus floridulus TaxID=154761 RepID=UPI00345748AD